ncbi:MAG: peroxiredoxin [Alphaproteobacteria bacterium]
MAIKINDPLPETRFMVLGADGPQALTTAQICTGKKVALFGVPGAFTPTCHNSHLPGFLDSRAKFTARGIDTIACVSVNDMYVMDAWAKASGANVASGAAGEILFLADGNGDFARATGLVQDGTKAGMGQRLKRFSMIIDNGIVTELYLEDRPGVADATSAANLLLAL